MNLIKAVIDTNVVISAMRSTRGASHQLLLAIFRHQIQPVLSVALALEYEAVARRPGMIPALSQTEIAAILNVICARAHEQRIFFRWRPFLKDPNDDMLVELALAAGAQYIVTSNYRDLAPAERLGIQVLEPRKFLHILPPS